MGNFLLRVKNNLTEGIYSRLKEEVKQTNSLENIKFLVFNLITIFRKPLNLIPLTEWLGKLT